MLKEPDRHNTPQAIVEEILRLHIEEGYTYCQLAEKLQKPFITSAIKLSQIQMREAPKFQYFKAEIYEYLIAAVIKCGKAPRSASTLFNPTTEQLLALQRENRQLRMENELLRGFHCNQEKR